MQLQQTYFEQLRNTTIVPVYYAIVTLSVHVVEINEISIRRVWRVRLLSSRNITPYLESQPREYILRM